MTLKVRISHEQPGYDKAALISVLNKDGVPQSGHVLLPCPQGQEPGPNQFVELYVHDNARIVIDEGPIPEQPAAAA